ncbi:NnrU family protein [Sphingomonas sp.]|uniref:NnrU family protein n=1 Tax=Sphingomonas sp. TaxID=28214 RepID=UPI0038A144D6
MTVQIGLLLSAIAFVGTHFLLSHPLRARLVESTGEKAFQGLYSVVALITFGLMVYFYRKCGREPPLWDAGLAGWIAGTLLMWLASILFVGSFVGNPALPGARGRRGGPRGVFALTRHPMMWGFALWAAVHLMILAQPKSIVFDGAIILLALAGAAGQDRKKAQLMGEAWHEWTAQTAFVPFTRGLANPGAVALAGGTLLFLIATWAHPVPAGIWRWI